jgi:hypothetical protein
MIEFYGVLQSSEQRVVKSLLIWPALLQKISGALKTWEGLKHAVILSKEGVVFAKLFQAFAVFNNLFNISDIKKFTKVQGGKNLRIFMS